MTGMILSADIGTSSLKAAYIDFEGRLIAFGRELYGKDVQGFGTYKWEKAFANVLENLHEQLPGRIIDAVIFSGNGPTLTPITKDNEALSPLFWYDCKTRAKNEADSFFLPHVAWFKENTPEQYNKTRLFLSPHEWLSYKLGAKAMAALPSKIYEPYYWNDEQCRLYDLDRARFPPFIEMGKPVGRVSAEAASFLGPYCGNCLKSGVPIIAGGPDFISALIGTGTMKVGDVCDRAGSSEGINVCAPAPVNGEDYKVLSSAGLRALPHAKEGLWNIGAVIPISGRLFDQYRIESGQQEREYGELLEELIPSTFPIPHSALNKGQAVLCAMAYTVHQALDTLGAAGFTVREMKVSGGQGKNPFWNQLKADITGVTLMLPEITDGELAGNAVLAAAALGAASSVEEAVGKMIRVREQYQPRNTAFWDEKYLQYLKQSHTEKGST